MVRTGLIILVLVGFAGLSVLDLASGSYGTGAAAICLGAANTLLFLSA